MDALIHLRDADTRLTALNLASPATLDTQASLPGPTRPQSAVSVATGLVGFVALAVGLSWSLNVGASVAQAAVLCLVLPALTMVLWEVLVQKSHRKPETGLNFTHTAPFQITLQRCATKLIAIWATWAILGAIYALIPYYEDQRFVEYFNVLQIAGPFLVLASIPYVFLIDRHMIHPYDENWHFGLMLLGRWNDVDKKACKRHILNYSIKGFFLAFMFSIFTASYGYITSAGTSLIFSDRLVFYVLALEMLYFVDIAFGTIGYVMTFKIFGSQIRTPNSLLLGWVVALACYPPFAVMGNGEMLNYGRERWELLIPVDSYIGVIVIALILGLTAIYAWSTVAFGIRFSNLTHRGIITNGPYALTKHPAYLTKNIAWWLMYVPFIPAVSIRQALSGCLSLVVVNGIYYVRAKTEEAHLMEDPTYRAYAAYIRQYGLITRLRRVLCRTAAHG